MEQINVEAAPQAVGPYCHAVKTGNLVFCSGQIPLDPESMEIVGETVEEQTQRVLENISIVLGKMDLTLKSIVKTTVFLKEISDFSAFNKVYAERLDGHKPSRSTVAVKQLPLDAMVEIECIAEIS